ncbi:hypothetical protein KK083_12135 [Fulvivirgaceae bacterium PWU4]|uniref:Lipocalin-like domain-containing protein n=1 Tax=Chryseosolibacter histidini TaxID=2782349 RepID=A0AAP2DK95_9BACT|nr:hypothetical protein [Chryseosolibacter histidini]MBT1697631.1 hypothetical protein [Chryseosolibacter histidini]
MMMKNLFTKIFALLSVLIVSACGEDGPDFLPVGDTLEGAWIMTEYGYSPGAGYVTKEVPTDPAKTITFRIDGTLTSNIDEFSTYPYYLILEDPHDPGHKLVGLFTTKPTTTPDINTVSRLYHISFTEDLLKLSMRGCIEGCHVGLKRTAHSRSGDDQ